MAGRIRYLRQRGDTFWARIAVPPELKPIVGQTELLVRLGANRRLAERELHAAVAKMHETLAAARAKLEVSAEAPPRMRGRPLTTPQVAHTHYAEELALDQSIREGRLTVPEPRVSEITEFDHLPAIVEFPDEASPRVNRGTPRLELYRERIASERAARAPEREIERSGFVGLPPGYRERQIQAVRRVASGQCGDQEMTAVVGWAIDKFRKRGSISAEPGTPEWRALARVLAQVQLEAFDASSERDAGREPSSPRLPILAEPPTPVPAGKPRSRGPEVSILDLFDAHIRALARAGKGAEAERRWRPSIKALVRFLGHDDARHLDASDIVRWREHLLESGLAARTVRDAHLGALRAVLATAVEDQRLPVNVAASVKVKVAKPKRTREKGHTDEEAVAILRIAKTYEPAASPNPATRESVPIAAAKRWLPWLAAFTGARVAELAQLRRQDVQHRDGTHLIRITPDAGSVKTDEFRDVPLHRQLIELGFIAFVDGAPDGPLFYSTDRPRRSATHPSKVTAKRVTTWVRGLGIAGATVDPFHGFRHAFKTIGREVGVDSRILDAIQGHAPRTAGDDYGDVTLKTRIAAIAKFPAYDLSEKAPTEETTASP